MININNVSVLSNNDDNNNNSNIVILLISNKGQHKQEIAINNYFKKF